MKKILLIILAIVLVGGAIGGYFLYSKMEGATKDVESLVNPDESGLSQDEFQGLAKTALTEDKGEGFQTFQKAQEQASELDAKLWLKILETQAKATSSSIRLAVVQELQKLDSPEALEILKKVAAEDEDEDVQMMAEMVLEEKGIKLDEEDSE